MKTNHDFRCNDVVCLFKYMKKGDDRCRLNNNIASQIFNEYGITTCEIGLHQIQYNNIVKQAIITIHQMIREGKRDGNM